MSKSKPKIVAVDGPAGSGKSSICAQVGARLGWTYINTGALYRAVGVVGQQSEVDLDDDAAVSALVEEMSGKLRWCSADKRLWYQNEDLTALLGTEEAGRAASKVARLARVRERLLPLQRQLTLSAPVGALVDGRDIGTVVFPDADLKIFLTASLEERSRRRLQQLDSAAGSQREVLADIMRGIAKRDAQDERRGEAPLRKADDAIELDTSAMSVDEVVEAIIGLLREHKLIV